MIASGGCLKDDGAESDDLTRLLVPRLPDCDEISDGEAGLTGYLKYRAPDRRRRGEYRLTGDGSDHRG